MWLPPLNHHQQFTIYFMAAQNDLPPKDSQSGCSLISQLPHFAIRVHVHVGFCSASGSDLGFDGISFSSKEILIPCRALIASPAKKAKKILCNKLSEVGIPFELDRVFFVTKPFGEDYSLSIEKEWIKTLQDFLHSILRKSYNFRHKVLPLELTIEKLITLPERQYKGWRCWYYFSKNLDPDFEMKYNEAITRPRTHEELVLCGPIFTFDQAKAAVLKDVDVGEEEEGACSICLEDLCNGREVKGLCCGHVFHEDCINEWFQRSQVSCPLCREPLPFRITWVTKMNQ